MPYNYQLSEEAENDVSEAYEWYEKKKGRVGRGVSGVPRFGKRRHSKQSSNLSGLL